MAAASCIVLEKILSIVIAPRLSRYMRIPSRLLIQDRRSTKPKIDNGLAGHETIVSPSSEIVPRGDAPLAGPLVSSDHVRGIATTRAICSLREPSGWRSPLRTDRRRTVRMSGDSCHARQ